MNTTSLIPNSEPSSTNLIRNLDSSKTSMQSSMKETVTISPSTVTIESVYQSTVSYFNTDSLYSETSIGLLTSGVFMITQDKSPGLIYSSLDSSLSATTAVCSTNTFKETLSTDMMSSETIIAGIASTETVSTGMTSSYKMFDIVSEVNDTTSIIPITDANVLTRYSLSGDVPFVQNTFDTFMTSGSPFRQSMESVITSTAMSNFVTSISEDVGFSSSFRLEAPRSSKTVLTAVKYESQTSQLVYKNTSYSQYFLTNSELSGTSRTITFKKGDLSTTPLSYSSVLETSSFNEDSISVTQNSLLSSLTIIQTSSIPNNEAESTSTERDSYIPTKLFSSMPDDITETVSSTYDDKFITSNKHILLVTSSLNTLGSFTSGIENSILTTESFVKMMSRYSNEFTTSSSSLDTFSTNYMKTTTAIQHGLSESSKDDIFISAAFGTIGAIILVVLIALVISRYLMQRNKSKDEKYDEISNQLGWSDDGGINSYNKNYISREYPFNSSIHLPLHSYNESPYLSYANYYKKNWDDNT